MTQNIIAIDFNGVKFLIEDGNTKLIRLNLASSVSGTPETLTNNIDGTNYQVPSAKKATVIFFESGAAGHASQDLIYADNEDGNTNSVQILDSVGIDTMPNNTIFQSEEVPADKWINMNSSSSAAHSIVIYIVEEDA